VCDALATAHDAGVVHRDVKPANILIGDEGRVKVCDFGIARITDRAQTALTAAATVVGTSAYMAPEQVRGEPVDARTDLYGAGCVVYAMLTGRPPFTSGSPVQIAWQQVHEAPVPVAALRPGLPPGLAGLVGALLASARRTGRQARRRSAQPSPASPGASPRRGGAMQRPCSPPDRPHSRVAEHRPRRVPRCRFATAPRCGRRRAACPRSASRPRRRPRDGSARPGSLCAVLGVAAIATVVFALGTHPGRPCYPAAAPTPASTTQAPPSADTPSETPTDPSSGSRPTVERGTGRAVEPGTGRAVERSAGRHDERNPTGATLAAARAAVQAQAGNGGLDTGTSLELNRRLDNLARDLRLGNADRAARSLRACATGSTSCTRTATLTGAGYTAVLAPVDQLAANLPTPGDSSGAGLSRRFVCTTGGASRVKGGGGRPARA